MSLGSSRSMRMQIFWPGLGSKGGFQQPRKAERRKYTGGDLLGDSHSIQNSKLIRHSGQRRCSSYVDGHPETPISGLGSNSRLKTGGAWRWRFCDIYYSLLLPQRPQFSGEGGTVAIVALRLLEGQRPIVDTFLGYNVMWFYPVAWLFKLTGPDYTALQAVLLRHLHGHGPIGIFYRAPRHRQRVVFDPRGVGTGADSGHDLP